MLLRRWTILEVEVPEGNVRRHQPVLARKESRHGHKVGGLQVTSSEGPIDPVL